MNSAEHIFPLLQDEAARTGLDLPLESLAEFSCLGSIVENRQEQTSWIGRLGAAAVDQAQAQAVLDAVAGSLDAEGWALDEDNREPADDPSTGRHIVYGKNGIIINATYRLGDPGAVEVVATTACVDPPTDHQMLRSTLDPSYGKSSSLYADGE